MSEPVRNEQVDVFGIRYQIWQRILQSTYGQGHVHVTQREIAIEYDMTERAVQKHYAALREAGLLERSRNRDGRVTFRVAPEHYWNFKVAIRNRQVSERNDERQNSKRDAIRDAMAERGMKVVEGGKS